MQQQDGEAAVVQPGGQAAGDLSARRNTPHTLFHPHDDTPPPPPPPLHTHTHLSHFSLMTTYCIFASLRPSAAASLRLRGEGVMKDERDERTEAGKRSRHP